MTEQRVTITKVHKEDSFSDEPKLIGATGTATFHKSQIAGWYAGEFAPDTDKPGTIPYYFYAVKFKKLEA